MDNFIEKIRSSFFDSTRYSSIQDIAGYAGDPETDEECGEFLNKEWIEVSADDMEIPLLCDIVFQQRSETHVFPFSVGSFDDGNGSSAIGSGKLPLGFCAPLGAFGYAGTL